MKLNPKTLWQENKAFIILLLLMIGLRTAIADWNVVPTSSMEPTIIPGDRIWVNKLAYDAKIPFTEISLYKFSDPKRGDIIVFNSKKADKRLIKRIIGMPGETIEMLDNKLYINGVAAIYSTLKDTNSLRYSSDAAVALHLKEAISDFSHPAKFYPSQPSRLKHMPAITIPEQHYFVLGDNRDNSLDSRYYGFIPRQEIIGRSRHVVLSLDYSDYYLPRSERFFHSMD